MPTTQVQRRRGSAQDYIDSSFIGAEGISTTGMNGWYQTSQGTVPRNLKITWRIEGMAA